MITLSLSEAKMKPSGLVEKVRSTDEEIVITRNGSPAAILISPDKFESFKETVAVKSDAELTEEINQGLKARKARQAIHTRRALRLIQHVQPGLSTQNAR